MTDLIAAAQRIVELGSKATPGEWRIRREKWPSSPAWIVETELSCINGLRAWFPVTTVFLDDAAENMSEGAFRPEDDATFIAFARNHAPEIARALQRAHAVVEAAKLADNNNLSDAIVRRDIRAALAAYRAGQE